MRYCIQRERKEKRFSRNRFLDISEDRMAASDPCSASFLSQVFSGNAVVCSSTFQQMETTDATAQIQSVVDNADTYYGEDSPAADTAATAAAQQEAHVSADISNITESISSSTVGQVFTTCDDGNSGLAIPGLPCIDWDYLLYGVIALIVLYFVAIISSFVPRPR
jgi:hypothetical protein